MTRLRRTTAALALVVVSGVGLSACGGDEPSGDPGRAPSSSATSESPSPSGTATVSADDAAAYRQALATMGRAFQTFSKDFTVAVKRSDDKAVIGSAATLRDAVKTFDSKVRQLDLSALQTETDRVLQDDQQIIDQLDAVTRAKNGPAAIEKLNSIDFQEFSEAFTDLGQKLPTGR